MDIVEGWTGRLEWTAKQDAVAVDLTGLTACFSVHDHSGNTISTTCANATEVITSSCGLVGFNPNTTTFLADESPYTVRLKVTDTFGASVFFPNGSPETVVVRSA